MVYAAWATPAREDRSTRGVLPARSFPVGHGHIRRALTGRVRIADGHDQPVLHDDVVPSRGDGAVGEREPQFDGYVPSGTRTSVSQSGEYAVSIPRSGVVTVQS